MLERVESGESRVAIASDLGVSQSRISQLVQRARHDRDHDGAEPGCQLCDRLVWQIADTPELLELRARLVARIAEIDARLAGRRW